LITNGDEQVLIFGLQLQGDPKKAELTNL